MADKLLEHERARRHLEAQFRPTIYADTSWQEEAACRRTSPEIFFPERGGSAVHAKKVCRCCMVRDECLDYAIKTEQRFGIWGGTSEGERKFQRRAGKPEPNPRLIHGTTNGYKGYGCRCPECTEAHRLSSQAWRDAQKKKRQSG